MVNTCYKKSNDTGKYLRNTRKMCKVEH